MELDTLIKRLEPFYSQHQDLLIKFKNDCVNNIDYNTFIINHTTNTNNYNFTNYNGVFSKLLINDDIYLNFVYLLYLEACNNKFYYLSESLVNVDKMRAVLIINFEETLSDSKLLNIIANEFINVYCEYHNDTGFNKDYYIIDNTTCNKFHIYFPNLICQKYILIEMVKLVKQRVNDMCNLGNCYINEDYSGCTLIWQKNLCDSCSHYRTKDIISYDFIIDLIKFRVRAFEWEVLPSLTVSAQLSFKLRSESFNTELTIDTINVLKESFKKNNLDVIYNYKVTNDTFYLNRKIKSECKVCKNIHIHDNASLTMDNNGNIYLYCYTSKQSILLDKSNINDEEDHVINPNGIPDNTNINSNVPEELPKSESINDNEKYFHTISSMIDLSTFEPILYNDKINLICKRPYNCRICGMSHENINHVICKYQGAFYEFCDIGMGKYITIYRYRDLTEDEKQLIKQKKTIKLKNILYERLPSTVKLDKYCQDIIRPLDINKPIQVIRSKMDSQKTVQLINFILTHKSKFNSILSLSSRCSFTNSMIERFKDSNINLTNYLFEDVTDAEAVMIQMESLHNLSMVYDLIILDEVTSCLCQMNSGLHRSYLTLNQMVLEKLIRNAKWIVMLDADIDCRAIELLNRYKPGIPIHMQYNTQTRGNSYRVKYGGDLLAFKCTSEKQCINALFKHIKLGHNVAVALSSKKLGDKIALRLDNENIKYLYHNSNNPNGTQINEEDKQILANLKDIKDINPNEEGKHILTDVNKYWINYQVVMYTSCIDVGIDFNIPHFHLQFIFGNSTINTVRQMKQMIGRIRNLLSPNIIYYNKIRYDTYPIDHNYIYNMIKSIFNDVKTGAKRLLSTDEKKYVYENLLLLSGLNALKFDKETLIDFKAYHNELIIDENGKFHYYLKDDYWNWLLIKNLIERNLSRNFFDILFDEMLKDQEFTIVNYNDPNDNMTDYEYSKTMINLESQVKQNDINLYNKIPLVKKGLYHKYKKLNDANQGNEYTHMAVDKYDFLKHFIDTSQIDCSTYFLYKDKLKQLHQLRTEMDLPVKNVLIEDIYHCLDNNNGKCPLFLKLLTIKIICDKLGFINSFDTNTIIDTLKIAEHKQWFNDNFTKLTTRFDIHIKKGSQNLKSIIDLLKAIFKAWNTFSFTTIKGSTKQQRINGKNVKISYYRLTAKSKLCELVNLMYPKIPSCLNSTTIKFLEKNYDNFLTDSQNELMKFLDPGSKPIITYDNNTLNYEVDQDLNLTVNNQHNIESDNKPIINYKLPQPYHPLLIEREPNIEASFNQIFTEFVNNNKAPGLQSYPYDLDKFEYDIYLFDLRPDPFYNQELQCWLKFLHIDKETYSVNKEQLKKIREYPYRLYYDINYTLPQPYHPLMTIRIKGNNYQELFNEQFISYLDSIGEKIQLRSYPTDLNKLQIMLDLDDLWFILLSEFYVWYLFLGIKTKLIDLENPTIPLPKHFDSINPKSYFDYYINIINKIRLNPYELYNALDESITFNSFDKFFSL